MSITKHRTEKVIELDLNKIILDLPRVAIPLAFLHVLKTNYRNMRPRFVLLKVLETYYRFLRMRQVRIRLVQHLMKSLRSWDP